MLQDILVAIIGLAAFSYAGYKIYTTLTNKKRGNNCSGCCSNCSIRERCFDTNQKFSKRMYKNS